MLQITIPPTEQWDNVHEQFVYTKGQSLNLEHSLVSISKWESRWHKPFLSLTEPETDEEVIDYIRCMTLTQNVDPEVYKHITNNNLIQVKQYIDNPMSATTTGIKSNKDSKSTTQSKITSELIYYWMIAFNIPLECQKWHLNRLFALIRICNTKNKPPKKMNDKQIARQYSEINAMRRKQLNSKG
jgi:hypothetical protein